MANGLAKRLDAVAPSATLAMTAKAAELKAAGRKIYTFGVGEPDFATPEFIREAAARALAKSSHYTAVCGTASLREAICNATERDRGWRPTPEMVTVSVGAKHALFNLAMVLADPGDEFLIPAPYWVSYPEQIRLFEGVQRMIAFVRGVSAAESSSGVMRQPFFALVSTITGTPPNRFTCSG